MLFYPFGFMGYGFRGLPGKPPNVWSTVMDDNDELCRRFFTEANSSCYHRQYAALQAVFVDGVKPHEVAQRFGYSLGGLRQLIHAFRKSVRQGAPTPFFDSQPSVGQRTPQRRRSA